METTCPYCGKIISNDSYYYNRHIHSCGNKHILSLRTATCHDSRSIDNMVTSMNNSTPVDNSTPMDNSTLNNSTINDQSLCNTMSFLYESSASSSSDDSDKSDDTSIRSIIGNLYHELNFNDDRENIIDGAVSTCDSLLIDDDIDYIDSDDNNDLMEESVKLLDDSIIHPFEAISLKFFIDNDIPISLFNEYIRLFLIGKKLDYTPSRKTTSYPYLINTLKASKRFPRHEYVTKKVNVYENININIRVFPFLENVKWLLNQKDLLHGSLWKYDPTSDVYSEMNTGYWWKNAEENMLHRTRNAIDDFLQVACERIC